MTFQYNDTLFACKIYLLQISRLWVWNSVLAAAVKHGTSGGVSNMKLILSFSSALVSPLLILFLVRTKPSSLYITCACYPLTLLALMIFFLLLCTANL